MPLNRSQRNTKRHSSAARRLALSGSAAGRPLRERYSDWGKAASCSKPEMRFTMALTHEELANLVGSSRGDGNSHC